MGGRGANGNGKVIKIKYPNNTRRNKDINYSVSCGKRDEESFTALRCERKILFFIFHFYVAFMFCTELDF